MKHFRLERLVILAVMLLISVASNAQETAPANMKAYRGNNGNTYTFQVTGRTGAESGAAVTMSIPMIRTSLRLPYMQE